MNAQVNAKVHVDALATDEEQSMYNMGGADYEKYRTPQARSPEGGLRTKSLMNVQLDRKFKRKLNA